MVCVVFGSVANALDGTLAYIKSRTPTGPNQIIAQSDQGWELRDRRLTTSTRLKTSTRTHWILLPQLNALTLHFAQHFE